ncbi:MAG: DUF2306 domain-containing protein [Actinomycetia bacterium]|nr:DUF2306 domain-containing protein [Actinomycetes bacterium]
MATFTPVIAVHASVALIVILLGPLQILRPRRDRAHRILGRTFVVLMVLTSTTSFFIHPDGFTWLHGLAIVNLLTLGLAVGGILKGNVEMHKRAMIGAYASTLIAFIFASAMPDRLIQTTLRSEPATILLTSAGLFALIAAWSTGVIWRLGSRQVR